MKGKKKTGKCFVWGKWILCMLLVGCMLSTIGCGKSAQSSADSSGTNHSESGFGTFQADSQKTASEGTTAEDGATEATVNTDDAVEQSAQDSEEQGTEFEQVEGANTEQKLIKTVNMSAETTEFDTLVADVRAKTESAGGYVENSDIGGNYGAAMTRYAYLVLRIPADKLDDFVGEVKNASNVRSFGESTEDVTLQYTDLDTHIKALREELDALFSMMEQATSMKDILAIQSQITEVRYEIENYESQLRVYDNQVTYSTVYLDLYEVNRESSTAGTTFGERVKIKFNDNLYQMGQGFQNFMVGLLGGLPILLPIVVICVAVIVVLRKFWKKKKSGGQEKTEE
ncbi:DUF4349 domain-containing protein [uncultured Eubacterium sp.]|uniref:DUF4349 domain-containing protein n=1 Tax=uncultured Eubacterium sp. TaxID=165185 RepID=UPI0025D3F56C|nr:DUF4349 domain-containing protein [uncultured Eubacterium sp.]